MDVLNALLSNVHIAMELSFVFSLETFTNQRKKENNFSLKI